MKVSCLLMLFFLFLGESPTSSTHYVCKTLPPESCTSSHDKWTSIVRNNSFNTAIGITLSENSYICVTENGVFSFVLVPKKLYDKYDCYCTIL